MRAPCLVLAVPVLLLLAQVPADAGASGAIVPTIEGPPVVNANRFMGFSGRLVANGPGTGVPLLNVNVSMYLDGALVAWDATDAMGRYVVQVSFPLGAHTLEARVFDGSPQEGRSAPFTVTSNPTHPGVIGAFHARPGFYYTHTNLTWGGPWTDGGYPVTSYTIERSDNGGPYAPVFSGLATAFSDTSTLPGVSYRYRGTATTSWGTSNMSDFYPYDTNDTVVTIGVVGFQVCEEGNCTDIPDAGSVLVNATANVTVTARVAGIADHYPASPPGIDNVQVLGRIQFPEHARNFTRFTVADGTYHANVTGFWAHAPVTGCETFGVHALARHAAQGHMDATGSFALCV